MDSFTSTSSTDGAGMSSASLMMIAQHFFQEQQGQDVDRVDDWMDCLLMSETAASHSPEDLWLASTSGSSFAGADEVERLIQLLVSCLDDIEGGQSQSARSKLVNLRSLGNPYGDAVQKSACYFGAALESRLVEREQGEEEKWDDEEEEESMAVAYKTLNDACPYLKFAHLTANQALLEATQDAQKIHIIDYGTMHGVQWAAFLQAFATWPSSRRRQLRITGIPGPALGRSSLMTATKRRLTEFARLVYVDLEFEMFYGSMEDLPVQEGEVVAVNLVMLAGGMEPALQELVQRVSPRIVTVAEFETNKGSGLREQIASNCRFYCSVFDSMDVAMGRDDPQRVDAERRFFGKEIRKSLKAAISSISWQPCAGLWSASLSNYTISQARLLLWLYNKSDNFTLTEAPGCLSLGWLGTPIVTVSTWHCPVAF